MANIERNLAAKELDISLRSCGDQSRDKMRVNTGLAFIRWSETQLQTNASVAPGLLDV